VIVQLLLESKDLCAPCVEEGELIKKVVEMSGVKDERKVEKKVESIRRSINAGFNKGLFVWMERVHEGKVKKFVCLADPEVLEHRKRLLSIAEDIYLKLTYPTGSSPTKKYEPVPEVDKPKLLTSLAEHLLADKSVRSAIGDLLALSQFASSYCDGFMKLCIDKARKLCPRHASNFADRLRDAVRVMVRNRDHVDQIVEELSRGIRGSFGLPHGMEGRIAEVLRELYEYFGDALLLCDEISIAYNACSRDAVDKILNAVKSLAVEGRLVGRCSICGKTDYDRREVEQLKSILQRYLEPPPPPSLIIKDY
jgi:hypothetical protein